LSVSGPGKSNPFTLRVVFNAALFEELAKISSILDPHFGATSASPQNSDSERAFSLPKAIADLLLQLHVTLGRTTLPLDSVLKLNVGSVIELGRAPNAPVDVVVNGRIIASGQVVACNGNYGVRIVAADQREMGGEQCPREC
jgi:flagellar motor switch protein FliN